MDKDTRNTIERATQRARKLLEDDFASQLEGTFDVLPTGDIAATPGAHLTPRENLQRDKIVAAIERKRAAGLGKTDAVADYLREAAFTTLNRFVALKTLEARALVQECVSKGDQSAGYREFHGLAPDIALLPNGAGYRLYIESLFDELSTAVKVLFDRRDVVSVLWPKHTTFETLLEILNATDLTAVWNQDETIGWVYQFFNSSEERRKMRDESLAPRNSRELAVRNQFFTPRYVVEFLVDNTLGRTWLEMHGQGSSLSERCRYFVRGTDESPQTRPKKDPRDLRILDPACGSGHFLLYCFDLLLVIYEEAWLDPEQVPSKLTGGTLREDHPELTDLAAFRRKVPILIVEHNLYGVDIDPRAAQIAAFALWLRAQRAFKDLNIPAANRDPVSRTHIVIAEPMPGDSDRVEEFASRLDPPLLGQLFRKMVREMRLAGELGTLLPVEMAISTDVALARREFEESYAAWQGTLPGFEPPKLKGDFNLVGIEHEEFFEQAEDQLLTDLQKFAESATGGENTRRKLFAGDATQGIALIELLHKRFDVVLMNPPFGEPTGSLPSIFKKLPKDLYCCFVERASSLLKTRGLVGAITSASFRTYVDYESFRKKFFSSGRVMLLADLGWGVLDGAYVETAAYVIESTAVSHKAITFIDVRTEVDRGKALELESLHPGRQTYSRNATRFDQLPATPLIYWWSDATWSRIANFQRLSNFCESIGKGAGPHVVFYRLRWEVSPESIGLDRRWATFTNGGPFSPFRREDWLVLRWENNGAGVKSYLQQKYPYLKGNTEWNIQMEEHYGLPGLTYGKKTTMFSAQTMPAGSIFSFEGMGVFSTDEEDRWWLLAYLNSAFVRWYLNATCGLHKNPPYVRNVPVPALSSNTRHKLTELAKSGWIQQLKSSQADERSAVFTLPRFWSGAMNSGAAIRTTLAEIDAIVQTDTGLNFEDLYDTQQSANELPEGHDSDEGGEVQSESLLSDCLSWAVGVAFGRFDVRLAIGERAMPPDPLPFAPLPLRSPGMWPTDEPRPEPKGVFVDDEGHPHDLVTHVAHVGERSGFELPQDLRQWLAGEFFSIHLKKYSKNRRKAPIYWQLATPSAHYSIWLYIHSLSQDTLFRVQNDFITPKLALEQRRLESMLAEQRDVVSAAERKTLARQQEIVSELRVFLDEVKRVAPLWSPDLDDGVAINFAPLWRLVSHHKAWQKELKGTWEAISSGEYDWSHLAMRLWPEKVVPKCATDRSLAIAHDLEDVFWIKSENGKWAPRETPARSIADLVRERTSPAVKASLKSLLEASSASQSANSRKRKEVPKRTANRGRP